MAEPCFKINDSNPPVCGVHHVALIQRQSSEDSVLSKFGDFAFFVCPVSGYVVRDSAPQKPERTCIPISPKSRREKFRRSIRHQCCSVNLEVLFTSTISFTTRLIRPRSPKAGYEKTKGISKGLWNVGANPLASSAHRAVGSSDDSCLFPIASRPGAGFEMAMTSLELGVASQSALKELLEYEIVPSEPESWVQELDPDTILDNIEYISHLTSVSGNAICDPQGLLIYRFRSGVPIPCGFITTRQKEQEYAQAKGV
jgi:hypothetical protein